MNNRLASSDMEFIRCEIKARFIRKEIIKLYGDSDDPDKKAVADYLKHNSITVFPYTFFNKYKPQFYFDSIPAPELTYKFSCRILRAVCSISIGKVPACS